MTIDASLYIPVTNSVSNVLNNSRTFAGLALTRNNIIPTYTPLVKFNSVDEVADYFGTNSSEHKSALKYFASYTVTLNFPPYMYFGKLILSDISPYLHSSVVTDPAAKLIALQAITSGQLTVVVNGTSYATSSLNLSSATSLSNVASILTTAITTAHAPLVTAGFIITYDGSLNKFISFIGDQGASATMNYFSSSSGSLATIMQMTLATGATLSQGADEMTVTQNLDALKGDFTDQFSIFFVDDLGSLLTDDLNLELMQWVNDQGDKYWAVIWSNEIALESSTDTTSIWYLATQAALNNWSVFDEVIYNNSDRVSAASGIFASIDLTQPNSAITLAFKTQDGLLPSVTNTGVARILGQKGINYYGLVALTGSPQTQNVFYPGRIGGKWTFIDNLVGVIWIDYQCQFQTFEIFVNTPQVPIDPDGQSIIRSGLRTALENSKTSGIVVTGLVFDNATQIEIRTLYGIDAIELTNNGYAIINTLPAAGLRLLRESSPWYVIYAKGSAYQFLPINTRTFY